MKPVAPARLAAVLAALAALGLVALVVEILATGRTRPPSSERAAAVAAYERASSGPAAAWAGDELRAADAALRSALLDWSRQEARFLPRRDFRPVFASLARAQALADAAGAAGSARRDAARTAAEQAVAEAGALESHAQALVAATTLPRGQRTQLLRARLLLREAETLLAQGDVAAAAARARGSQAELRRAVGPALAEAERYRSREQVATWQRWIEETRRASKSSGKPAILVLKEKNLLVLLAQGVPVKSYDAEVGANALGLKHRQGDRATPEGRYRVVKKKDRGQSVYHRALLLDYPNAADRARFAAAQKRGEIPRGAAIGGLIEIHGDGGRGQNWTDGCVALRNPDMDDLFARVGVGTRVTIVGGDGSDGAFSSLLARLEEGGS